MVSPEEPISSLPADLQEIVRELARSEQAAWRVLMDLSEEQQNWQPDDGKAWSILQCLDHLAKTNTVYIEALRAAVRKSSSGAAPRRGAIQPAWLARFFLRSLEPPPRQRVAARPQVRPAARLRGDQVLQDFLQSHQEIRSLIHESSALDLNRLRFRNPFVPLVRFTVGTGLLVMCAHDRRHLWQAEQVRARLDNGA
jgi:DinB family protein